MGKKSVDIYGTLGPSCDDTALLKEMFDAGMTGIRINMSHIMLTDCMESILRIHEAAGQSGIVPKILIDMQGPELRIGRFRGEMILEDGKSYFLGSKGILLEDKILEQIETGDEILFDDGRILAEVTDRDTDLARIVIRRGGKLTQKKSVLVKGREIMLPAVTDDDRENLRKAGEIGIAGIMQPFVRSREDLLTVRRTLMECGCGDMKVFAKIENRAGIENLESYFDVCDEIVIARGDLGNSMPLWKLPGVQKEIAAKCTGSGMPFMVVTQMLSSMEKSRVPTRAEVSDIYNSVLDGASSVMVTGETAVGDYPVEVIRFLANTVREALCV